MERGKLLRRLQWFHAVEVNQVALYKAQALLAIDELDRLMFNKAAEIESTHIENMLSALHNYGGEPSPLALLAPVIGAGTGTITSSALAFALRADVALENIAMRHYAELITACDDRHLRSVLWSNYLDESLHTEWFKSRIRKDVDQQASTRKRHAQVH